MHLIYINSLCALEDMITSKTIKMHNHHPTWLEERKETFLYRVSVFLDYMVTVMDTIKTILNCEIR
jgi:hypothetical protein